MRVRIRATVNLPGLLWGQEAMVDTDLERIRQFIRATWIVFVDKDDELAYLAEISAREDSVTDAAVPSEPSPNPE